MLTVEQARNLEAGAETDKLIALLSGLTDAEEVDVWMMSRNAHGRPFRPTIDANDALEAAEASTDDIDILLARLTAAVGCHALKRCPFPLAICRAIAVRHARNLLDSSAERR